MELGSILGAAGSVLGGIFGGNQADKAAEAQEKASRDQIALARETRDLQNNLLAPFVRSGMTANDAYLYELGLGPRPTVGGTPATVNVIPGAVTGGSSASGGGSRYSAYEMARAKQRAESMGGEAAREYRRMLSEQQIERVAGSMTRTAPTMYEVNGQRFGDIDQANAFARANPTGGEEYRGFTKTPGYDFRLRQGIEELESSAAARGRLFSGATMQGATEYGQDYATSQYEPYLNRLAGLAGNGQSAAAGQAAVFDGYASRASAALGDAGNARSAGYIAKGNAISDGIDNAISAWSYFNNQGRPPLGSNARYISG